jgi:hypothetical protein
MEEAMNTTNRNEPNHESDIAASSKDLIDGILPQRESSRTLMSNFLARLLVAPNGL